MLSCSSDFRSPVQGSSCLCSLFVVFAGPIHTNELWILAGPKRRVSWLLIEVPSSGIPFTGERSFLFHNNINCWTTSGAGRPDPWIVTVSYGIPGLGNISAQAVLFLVDGALPLSTRAMAHDPADGRDT